ncbi:isoprenoid synthase domain-containing protein [Amylostereum chailletii]|nr:isoprenoid synthase domain-containing protein [Amylostereum chailletii]
MVDVPAPLVAPGTSPTSDSLHFPSHFTLQNLPSITSPVFNIKDNPFQNTAEKAARQWFEGFGIYDDDKLARYLRLGKFDTFASLAFPNADAARLETCLAFFLWAFATDDLSDEGDFQAKPQDVQTGVDISLGVLYKTEASRPSYPYAAMLHDPLATVSYARIRTSTAPGVSERFCSAFEDWGRAQVEQPRNRALSTLPTVEDFIVMCRVTIGGRMVEAMIEYSLDIDLPDHVLAHPIVAGISEAAIDIYTWPNDLCSLNKEQADGGCQNLVCVSMAERAVDLQTAVDTLTDMLLRRVEDYASLKRQLPTFGPSVDARLSLYHQKLGAFRPGHGGLVLHQSKSVPFPRKN